MTLLPATVAVASESLITVGGLPLHPLLVHAVVVLLPLSALGLIALIVQPRWRAKYQALALTGLVLGAGATVIAAKAGEQLALVTGITDEHRFWGDNLAITAVVLAIVALAVVADGALERSRGRAILGAALRRGLDAVSVLIAVAALVMTVVVGHSGASAVWPSRVDAAAASPAVSASPTGTDAALTMAAVSRHDSRSSCWTVIDGNVYDVTHWISRHPGGSGVIEALCGIDASAAFTNQHGGQGEPNAQLGTYRLGALAAK